MWKIHEHRKEEMVHSNEFVFESSTAGDTMEHLRVFLHPVDSLPQRFLITQNSHLISHSNVSQKLCPRPPSLSLSLSGWRPVLTMSFRENMTNDLRMLWPSGTFWNNSMINNTNEYSKCIYSKRRHVSHSVHVFGTWRYSAKNFLLYIVAIIIGTQSGDPSFNTNILFCRNYEYFLISPLRSVIILWASGW